MAKEEVEKIIDEEIITKNKIYAWSISALIFSAVALVFTGLALYFAASPMLICPVSPPTISTQFDGHQAFEFARAQVEFGPRPTGSPAGWATGDYILASLAQSGWAVESQPFVFKGVPGRNIIGKRGQGPVILLGAHYDTRPAAEFDPDPARRQQWIDGANDGASGVAVLLELARILDPDQLNHEVWLVFFDAEDRGLLQGWPFSVGARFMADALSFEPTAVIVVDMVGNTDQTLYFEYNSDLRLQRELWAIGTELGYQLHFRPRFRHAIVDDHLPFAERGIRAINIIDFDYPYWHTTADTLDKISPASLERVGRTLEVWLKARA